MGRMMSGRKSQANKSDSSAHGAFFLELARDRVVFDVLQPHQQSARKPAARSICIDQ